MNRAATQSPRPSSRWNPQESAQDYGKRLKDNLKGSLQVRGEGRADSASSVGPELQVATGRITVYSSLLSVSQVVMFTCAYTASAAPQRTSRSASILSLLYVLAFCFSPYLAVTGGAFSTYESVAPQGPEFLFACLPPRLGQPWAGYPGLHKDPPPRSLHRSHQAQQLPPSFQKMSMRCSLSLPGPS